jgi:hypothetical protein
MKKLIGLVIVFLIVMISTSVAISTRNERQKELIAKNMSIKSEPLKDDMMIKRCYGMRCPNTDVGWDHHTCGYVIMEDCCRSSDPYNFFTPCPRCNYQYLTHFSQRCLAMMPDCP